MIYVILGLLMLKNLTIYDINKILDKEISPFYSSSYGSIQSALKKLMKEELISLNEMIQNGRNKKIYSINPSGKETFMSWLESDIPVFNKRDNTLNRYFFFGFLEKDKQISILEKFIVSLKESLIEFNLFEEKARKKEVDDFVKNMVVFQLETLEYGIEKIKFDINWYQKQINIIKEID